MFNVNDEDLVGVISLSYITCLTEVQRVKYLSGMLRKFIISIFLGLTIFLSSFSNQNLVGFDMLEKIWFYVVKI